MTEAQHREFLVDAGLAWRVVVAQQLRTFLASPLIALGLVTVFFGYLSVWGSSGFLWPLWDVKRQTFSDKLTKSVVVR